MVDSKDIRTAGAQLRIEYAGNRIRIQGPLDLQHFKQARAALRDRGNAVIDLAQVTRLDTAGALLIYEAECTHIRPEHQALLELVSQNAPQKIPVAKGMADWTRLIIRLGKSLSRILPEATELIGFMGRACVSLGGTAINPRKLRLRSITHHIETVGISAIPIISLVAFTMSIVIAYQGQEQLKTFGAENYTANLVAISVLREMGVLLTAIMIAGRSGSAFTAEIGAMKARQEIDALKSIGFEPFELLVVPRMVALLVALPLLTILADIAGLFGGALISWFLIDLSFPEFFERARNAADWRDFAVGMIKAPVFATVIALVGCMHGLKVSGSSESVGRETTVSVVRSIFLVLMLDGLFSIYFQKVGW